MVFISIANAVKLAPVDACGLNGEIYKRPIYCFSEKEKQRLLAVKQLFEDIEKFISSIYRKAERKNDADMVFSNSIPAYHKYIDCERLLSDYQNIKVPAVIKARGEAAIAQFKTWAEENRKIWETRKEYFYLRLSTEFNIPRYQIEELQYANSGPKQFRNLDLEQLEYEVDKLIRQAGRYYYKDEKTTAILKAFQKKTYLAYINAPIRHNPTGYSDDDVRALLRHYDETIKKPLKYCLIEYYKVKLNPELAFEGKLLDQLGFVQCRACIRRDQAA